MEYEVFYVEHEWDDKGNSCTLLKRFGFIKSRFSTKEEAAELIAKEKKRNPDLRFTILEIW